MEKSFSFLFFFCCNIASDHWVKMSIKAEWRYRLKRCIYALALHPPIRYYRPTVALKL